MLSTTQVEQQHDSSKARRIKHDTGIRPVAMAREPEEAAAAQCQLQCCICCFWGQLGILALSPGSIHPLCSCPRPASTSDLRLVEADGVSAPDCTQQGQPSLQHFVSLGQTGPKRLPLIATPRHLWLPNAIAREPEAAMAAQGQLQCRICCYWGQMGILAPIPSSIHPVCSCPGWLQRRT